MVSNSNFGWMFAESSMLLMIGPILSGFVLDRLLTSIQMRIFWVGHAVHKLQRFHLQSRWSKLLVLEMPLALPAASLLRRP
ncbi:MAG: hypothetical protein EA370_03550 [Wenzhouxiangella sp.]|nr:MAG: hypothetical protein EA370_03550 [Wenzhouxiangella sp.]